MKRIFSNRFIPTLLLYCLLLASCTREESGVDDIYILTGTALSLQQSSQPQSRAIAAISGGYSVPLKKVAFNITWNNLSSLPKGASLYAKVDGFADVLIRSFGVTEGAHAGLAAGEFQLTTQQVDDLKNGRWYYTVNTVNHPSGELKGRVAITRNQ